MNKVKTTGFSKTLLALIALLLGVLAGAGGFYLIGLTPRKNLGEELTKKTSQIQGLRLKLDSLQNLLPQVSQLSNQHETLMRKILQTDAVDELLALGKEVGGKWQVHSFNDIYILRDNYVFLKVDDGHIPAAALLYIMDVEDLSTWKVLWEDYE